MSHQIESMAFRGEPCWHGLGFKIDHKTTPEEMLKVSGLNWTVSKRTAFTTLDTNQFNEQHLTVKDFFFLVRDSDNKVLGPAGKEYVPTQNKQAFDFFKKFAEAGYMELETAGSLQGGKQVWVLARLNKKFTLPGGDDVYGYLLLSSPHQWGRSLVIKFTPIRVVCMNTFMMAMNDSKFGKGFRMPHVRAFDAEVAREAEISLGIATELFESFEITAKKLSATKVDNDITIRYIADIFQKDLVLEQFGKSFYKNSEAKQAELLMDPSSPKLDASQFKRNAYDVLSCINRQPGADLESTKGTLWGCFNAVTYFSDFVSGRDRDNSLYSNWFGPKAATKATALKRAVQMAEVSMP